ncbi:DNA ligase (ATP) [Blastomyces dermatitidis ER-3]|uniref:DNA ligase (ATP) n=1 Tax=Ajellomyces dermatitidis (strain ER-3 / ATCC MYA-2586) TaxID=559297 RepID=A0ABP2EZH7_AJEDR|nr:DNA ligase (ATP) [Blastomyces dermatitidis ER-3]EEQ89404.1 DNA ligase (ATP) [Blastomyces dermatitidis ER-3]
MGFKFSYVCDLFTSLETNLTLKASTGSRVRNPDVSTIINWFNQHGKQIHGGETDRLALLSCLLPERRPEIVFGLKEPSLVKVIGRCLLLGTSRRLALDSYEICGNGDLGQCVENVMTQAENNNPEESGVTVEEVDAVLSDIASRCRFSSPDVRRQRSATSVDEALGPILRRLTSRDAKWFTRIILKDLSPLTLPARLVLRSFHFLLPDLLLLQDSLRAAVDLLSRDPIKRFPWRPDPTYAKLLASFASSHISLTIGVKVGRAMFYKARSIKHCCKMVGKRTMSVERKYDGEYCQIHIDLSKDSGCIRIFSKSGKDSTADRSGIHSTVNECLRIGKSGCKISKNCILEGELLVWSDRESKLLPFHKLRKHVKRSGSFIGTENDSPVHFYEHLYIMLFDVLLMDDQVCLLKSYKERRELLRKISHPIDGRAGIAEQEYINFSLSNSQEILRNSFATAISQRWEGLVLKSSEEPYFNIGQQEDSSLGHWIKMKKDYIPGIGDTADFALIGARYDAREAAHLRAIKGVKWTSFFVGCRDGSSKNPYDARPIFRVVDLLNRHNVNTEFIRTLNQSGQFCSCDVDDDDAPFTIKTDQVQLPKVQVLFKNPFVVEMVGSGFEKPAGVNYFTLRFPRVLKIHMDRDVEDATTLKELQELAEAANSVPTDELSQEVAWLADRLGEVDGKSGYIIDSSDHSSLSPASIIPPNDMDNEQSDTSLGPLAMNELDASQKGSRAVSKKRPKITKSRSPCIAIHLDNTQTSADTPMSHSQDNSANRHLADLTNLSQPTPMPTYINTDDREDVNDTSIPENEVECSTTFGERDEDKLNHFSQLRQRNGSRPNPSHEQQSSPEPTVGLEVSNLAVGRSDIFDSKPIPSVPECPLFLSETPILLGTGVSHDQVDSIPLDTKQLLTPSTADFLERVLNAKFPDTPMLHSSSLGRTQAFPKCSGIVLVESNTANTPQAASDIARIGNALATTQRASGMPSQKGKIIFLRCEAILQHGFFENNQTGHLENIQERWERLGKRLFAGCLKWGYGITACPRKGKRKRRKFRSTDADFGEKDGAGRAMANGSPSLRTMDVDVQLSWDWREILSLV